MMRDARPDDAPRIARIYNHYISNTIISFEEIPLTSDAMRERMQTVADAGLPWLVYLENELIQGYCYAGRWHTRASYRYTVESTVYLDPSAAGRGIGQALYTCLIDRLRELGYHAVIGGIALPNEASVRLHEKLGFQQVAHYRETGFKDNRWIDVGYWELLLEQDTRKP